MSIRGPLLGISYDDIIDIVWLSSFILEFLFRKAVNGFVCKIVSSLFVYGLDTLSVTSVSAVHLPKMTFNNEICMRIEINDKH